MKLTIQAIIASLILHIIYAITMIGIGYIQTINYKPDFSNENVVMLQNEVAFGFVYSPSVLIVTFLGAAVICGLIISFYQKMKKNAV